MSCGSSNLHIVFPVYPGLTQLDFTAPHQVLSRLPGATLKVASARGGIIRSDDELEFKSVALAEVQSCDVLCVPGGPTCTDAMEDAEYMAQIRRLAGVARYITSVCTGSLILGAAGLLRGRRATSHWAWRDYLTGFGASIESGRVVRDGNVITGGGITAGIDFALTLVAEIGGEKLAKAIQLGLEYAPAPPFDCGTPESADPSTRALVNGAMDGFRAARTSALARAAQHMPDEVGPGAEVLRAP